MTFSMIWLMDDSMHPNAGLSLARMTIDPHFTTEAHRHPNCTEALHALAGSLEVRVDQTWSALMPGSTVLIPVGAVHQLRNTGSIMAELMIAYSAGTRIYEKAQ